MSENEPENEHENYTPGADPCPDCGDVHGGPPNTNINPNACIRRVLTDAADEEYVNVTDLHNFMKTCLNAQAAIGGVLASLAGEDAQKNQEVGLEAMSALAYNIASWNRGQKGEAPSTPDEVPDEVPSEWFKS